MSVLPARAVAAARRAPVERPDPLDRLDRLAAALVRSAAPIRFAIARTDDELAAVYRLRYRAVIERGWATPDELRDGMERDEWDAGAVHVGGWLGEDLVACARIVFPTPGRPLPVEAVFDLTVSPVGRVVHVDRLVVARALSEPSHRILHCLLARCWQETRARGCHVWAGIDSRLTTRLYRSAGYDVEVLGPGRSYWSEERFPVRFDVQASAGAIAARWEALLSAPSDGPT